MPEESRAAGRLEGHGRRAAPFETRFALLRGAVVGPILKANQYHSPRMPVFLFTAYAKSVKADLTPAERNELRRVVAELVTTCLSEGA